MNTDTLRSICLQMPKATEDIKWGNDLVFSIGGKMFCATSFELPFKASFKVDDDAFEELCNQTGFSPAPYLARAKWVMVDDSAGLTAKEWQEKIEKSYRLVAAKLPAKQKRELGFEESGKL